MTAKRKDYLRILSKTGLLVLYLFLLTPQCHSRFYTVANFYLFSRHASSVSANCKQGADLQNQQSRADHLRLDKRYRNVSNYAGDVLAGGQVCTCTLPVFFVPRCYGHKPDAPVVDQVLSTHCLRGPPCA